MQKDAPKKLSNKDREREVKRQRTLVKEVLYPILLKNSKNIEDAKNMLAALDLGIQTKFNSKIVAFQTEVSSQPLSELHLDAEFKAGKQADRERELLTALAGEKMSTATGLLSGLQSAINSWLKVEQLKRDLKDLPADFL